MRYADDFVILARYQSRRLIDWTESLLEGRFRLTINREKTQVVKLNEPGACLTFLGFTLRYDRDLHGRGHRYLNVFPSKKALAHVKDVLRKLTGPRRSLVPLPEMAVQINCRLGGWGRYFRYGYPAQAFRQVDWFLLERLQHHLARRSQRPFRPPEGQSLYAHLQSFGLQFLWPTRR